MSRQQALPRGLGRRRSRLVRIALLTLGWSLLTLGLIGGLLPVIQGWPFGVAGAAILYVESRWVQRKGEALPPAPPEIRAHVAEDARAAEGAPPRAKGPRPQRRAPLKSQSAAPHRASPGGGITRLSSRTAPHARAILLNPAIFSRSAAERPSWTP